MTHQLHFFDNDKLFGRGFNFYRGHFPVTYKAGVRESVRYLDATPSYFSDIVAVSRIVDAYFFKDFMRNDVEVSSEVLVSMDSRLRFIIILR